MKHLSTSGIRFLAALIGGLLLVLLFDLAQPANPAIHRAITERLAAIREADADTDSLVLKLRYMLHDSYDGLVALDERTAADLAELANGPQALPGDRGGELGEKLRRLTAEQEKKAALVEHFKTYNSVLKNSLYYFPKLVDDISHDPATPDALGDRLDHLLREILLFHMGTLPDTSSLDKRIEALERSQATAPQPLQRKIGDALRHARRILDYETRVNRVMADILQSPARQAAERLNEAYGASFDRALQRTNFYRLLLLMVSLALLGYAALAYYRLRAGAHTLAEERSFLQSLTDALGEGVYALDRQGRCTFANPEAVRLLGWQAKELLGQAIEERIFQLPEGEDEAPPRPVPGETFHGETVFRRGDGSSFPVALVSVPLRQDEEVVGSVAAFQDISERRRAEETLRKFSRALAQSANSVIITNNWGDIEYVNPKFTEVTGYTDGEVVGRNPRLLSSGETSREEYARLWRTILDGQEWRGEFHNRRKDGSYYWEYASIGPIRDDHGNVTHFVAIKEDITHRKEIEAELRGFTQNLERRVKEETARNREKDHLLIQQSRLAAMGEMIGNIAHQWRQPLNTLNLILSNIKDAWDFKELDGTYLNKAVADGQRLIGSMSTTIDDFRNFFSPDKRKAHFLPGDAIDHAVALIQTSFTHASIRIDFIREEECELEGFPNEFSQVLVNILNNARDAIREREMEGGVVTIRLFRQEKHVHVTIADNAGGIPTEVIDKIFEPYFTTREKGTGIGLYMSKMIVENNMGGALLARNGVSGAEFEIVLPMD